MKKQQKKKTKFELSPLYCLWVYIENQTNKEIDYYNETSQILRNFRYVNTCPPPTSFRIKVYIFNT